MQVTLLVESLVYINLISLTKVTKGYINLLLLSKIGVKTKIYCEICN